MANTCGECALWQGSQDVNSYGERWCSYSRRYEKADQNTYGCRGFVEGGSSSSGGCFLTTACVTHKGLPDDCRELTVMRRVRDEWLVHQPGGKEKIDEYYRIAPGIVKKIGMREDCVGVWEKLYQKYLLPCVAAAEEGKNETAYEIYCEMIEMCKGL